MSSTDLDFERRMLLARLRSNLMDECPAAVEELRRGNLKISVENVETQLLFCVAHVRPCSALVPWHLPDSIVDKMIHFVARDFLREPSGKPDVDQ